VKRLAASHVRESLGLSERKACLLVDISTSVYRYQPMPGNDGVLRHAAGVGRTAEEVREPKIAYPAEEMCPVPEKAIRLGGGGNGHGSGRGRHPHVIADLFVSDAESASTSVPSLVNLPYAFSQLKSEYSRRVVCIFMFYVCICGVK
jgi:hypothetical protein